MSAEAVAALDCGTNSTRLLIETLDGEVLSREMQITRLGQDVDATGSLHPDAVARTLATLREYRSIMDSFGVKRGRLAATSAARDASNGPEFLEEASAVSGVMAEILSGDEEARLSYAGAMVGVAPANGDDLVLDIGGGSTEIVLVRRGEVFAHSMQVGCVRVSERTLHTDPPSTQELADARAMAEEALDEAETVIPELRALTPDSRMVALAGTVATLAMIDQHLEAYDRDLVHHYWLSLEAIRDWLHILSSETTQARSRRAGMVKGREDVIVGGLVVLVATLERLGLEGALTSESDILDGMVASMRSR
jgi:exopolyphosphatase/guanosine-5'-triphosphate,3'-diphosphate pyrophosphatase